MADFKLKESLDYNQLLNTHKELEKLKSLLFDKNQRYLFEYK